MMPVKEKLKNIKTHKIIKKVNQDRQGFAEFIKDYNVVQLAIGVVIGNAVKDLVSSIANNLLMPLIGLLTPSGSWQSINLNILNTNFKIGLFLSSMLDFLIVALVVYVVVKKMLKVDLGSVKK